MNSVRPISVIGKQRVGQANLVGPVAHLGETETLQKGNREFALRTRWDQSLISVRPKCYEGETESLHCNVGGTNRSSRLDRNVTKGNREFAIHLSETEVTRVSGSGYVK